VFRIQIRIDFGRLDPDPGKNEPQKIEKREEISSCEMLVVLF
jgi:hypothetical protein